MFGVSQWFTNHLRPERLVPLQYYKNLGDERVAVAAARKCRWKTVKLLAREFKVGGGRARPIRRRPMAT